MFRVRSVRFRLLAAVNVAIVLLLGVYVALDYRHEIADRVAEKRVALEEETKTLLPAIMRLRPQGKESLQRYIDDVCGRMQETLSPGHHIAVRLGETVLQAAAHHRASPEMFEAMESAGNSPKQQANYGEKELVVGTSQQSDTIVYVSEYLSSIRESARKQALQRLPRIVLLMVVAAAVVNVVFVRMAAKPLQQLVDTVRQIGGGKLDIRAGPFKGEEFDYLAEAINSMSSSLAETEQRRRLEMDQARNIQQQLLPDESEASGLTFAHLYQPAEDVAGDYYDVISMPDGTCLACIADVTGHGVPAALSAMMLKAYLLDGSEHSSDPGKILEFINHRLAVVSRTENFASMFIYTISPNRNTLRYASAGHEKGLLLRADGSLSELTSTGIVLGILEGATYETQAIRIGPGDRLLLFIDGVAEAMNQQGEQFGRQRLAYLFVRCFSITIQQCIEQIDRMLTEFCRDRPQNDDITLLASEVI